MRKKQISLIVVILALLTAAGIWRFLWFQPIRLTQVPWIALPGWKDNDARPSLAAFQRSCNTFLKQDPEQDAGSPMVPLKVKDWQPACRALQALPEPITQRAAKDFFETWFEPVAITRGKPVKGLFTGYYSPLLEGSLTRSEKYAIPLYGMPNDLVTIKLGLFDPDFGNRRLIGRVQNHEILPYFTRAEIDQGAIKNTAPVIVWVTNPLERLFLEIEGSGIIRLDNGKRLYVGYAGQNGARYTSIAKTLINKGLMTADSASMQAIRRYFLAHPNEMDPLLHENQSFVFFKTLEKPEAYGSQGVALTAEYSMAVDRNWIPMGTPLWLETSYPDPDSHLSIPMRRLMIAQDTGGAIRGVVRGDFYWGTGKKAEFMAGHMKNKGQYWMLVPRH
jgi:membrane-bound lytic murein transglycosylase A